MGISWTLGWSSGQLLSSLGGEGAPSLSGSQRACQTLDVEAASPRLGCQLSTRSLGSKLARGDLFFLEQFITVAGVGSPVPPLCSCLYVQLDFLKESAFRISC